MISSNFAAPSKSDVETLVSDSNLSKSNPDAVNEAEEFVPNAQFQPDNGAPSSAARTTKVAFAFGRGIGSVTPNFSIHQRKARNLYTNDSPI